MLEADDNLHNQNFTGLTDECCNLDYRSVEFVEQFCLGEVKAYRLAVMLDNDYLITFFTLAGVHEEELNNG
ncbi:hypothetical protein D1872_287380 [compost metagenome]